MAGLQARLQREESKSAMLLRGEGVESMGLGDLEALGRIHQHVSVGMYVCVGGGGLDFDLATLVVVVVDLMQLGCS